MSDVIYNNYAKYFNDSELIEEFNLNDMVMDDKDKNNIGLIEEFNLNDMFAEEEKPKNKINYDLYKDNLLKKVRDNLTLQCTLSLDESDYVIDRVLSNKKLDYNLLSNGNNIECLNENIEDLKLYYKNSQKIREVNTMEVKKDDNKKLENLLEKKNKENRDILIKYDFIEEEENKSNNTINFSLLVFFILVFSYIIKKYFGCK